MSNVPTDQVKCAYQCPFLISESFFGYSICIQYVQSPSHLKFI